MTTQQDMPTVEVPAEIYDEALAFCNARLREQGNPEITELPPGAAHNVHSCPCANASGVKVGIGCWWRTDGPCNWTGAPERFVKHFDDACDDIYVPALPIRKAS